MYSPTLIHVPHSSREIPEDIKLKLHGAGLQRELNCMTDHLCDSLFASPHEQIRFPVSRLVCDPERFRSDSDETMAKCGMGAVYSCTSKGKALRNISESQREDILRRFYDPHHAIFTKAVSRRIMDFGKCLIIDGHSFSSVPLDYEEDKRRERPDFCIGSDSFHTPPELISMVASFLLNQGYTVGLNRPYAGAIVPIQYYRKDGRVVSIMIEVNRRLYVTKEGNPTKDYDKTKTCIVKLISMLASGISMISTA